MLRLFHLVINDTEVSVVVHGVMPRHTLDTKHIEPTGPTHTALLRWLIADRNMTPSKLRRLLADCNMTPGKLRRPVFKIVNDY